MSKTLFKRPQALAAALLLVCGLGAQAASLSLSPSTTTVNTGSSIQLDLMLSELDSNQTLGVFELQLSYDHTLFSLAGYSFGTGLGALGLGEAWDFSQGVVGAGKLHLGELSLLDTLPVQGSGFKLGSVSFSARRAGQGSFGLSAVQFGDAFGNPLPVDKLTGTSVAVSAVPEPGSYALLAVGLGALGLLARRQRRQS